MKRLSVQLAAWMTALLLLGASSARADFLDWSYSWKITAGPTFTSNNSNISVALAPGAATGAATIPVAAISASSSSPTTDSFNAPYELDLTIKDNPTGQQGTLAWNGLLSGSVGPSSSTLQNSFSGSLTQSATLAGHLYQVTLEPNPANIPAPSSNSQALLDGQVVVTDVTTGGTQGGGGSTSGGGGSVSTTPEPSSLLLAGSALSLASLVGWRRRVRAAAIRRA